MIRQIKEKLKSEFPDETKKIDQYFKYLDILAKKGWNVLTSQNVLARNCQIYVLVLQDI